MSTDYKAIRLQAERKLVSALIELARQNGQSIKIEGDTYKKSHRDLMLSTVIKAGK